MNVPANARWIIFTTLFVCLLLSALPLPMTWSAFRPSWATLGLFYWVLALPHRVGVLSAALVGVLLDLIEGAPAGGQALGLVISTALLQLNYQRVRQFDIWQQSILIGLLISLSAVVERWIHGLLGFPAPGLLYLYPAGVSIFFWPLVREALRGIRRYYEVS